MKTEAEQTIQRKKQTEKRKENKKTSRKQQRTKYKGESKEQRERITRGESPSPRPIKERTTKISEQLVIGFVPVLKSSPILLPPNTPH